MCDVCNQAFIDKRELEPYLANVSKMQRAAGVRKTDRDLLSHVLEEVTERISTSARQSTTNEDETKFARLEIQKGQMSTNLNQVTREVQTLIAKERELNEDILRMDRVFEDKWKLLNEMYAIVT